MHEGLTDPIKLPFQHFTNMNKSIKIVIKFEKSLKLKVFFLTSSQNLSRKEVIGRLCFAVCNAYKMQLKMDFQQLPAVVLTYQNLLFGAVNVMNGTYTIFCFLYEFVHGKKVCLFHLNA